MEVKLNGNRAQLAEFILQPRGVVKVEGRGTGKSADIGFTMDRIIRNMPRCVVALTGKTYGQLLTRTLPSSLKILEQMGYVKGFDYVIGRKPPSNFLLPYEQINKFENAICFSNGTVFMMISQSEPGSGRGANVDFEIVDEALTINPEMYTQEVSPTNRGNFEYFGKGAPWQCYMHHGFLYSTSMPVTQEGMWVLDYADYYKKEAGIRLFDIWNKIVDKQVDLLTVKDPEEFAMMWNDIERMRKRIKPFVSKEGVLFTLANAFDNIDFLKLSYLQQNYHKLPKLVFLTEIMNRYFSKVEGCFYSLNESKQVYHNGFDSGAVRDEAERNDFDFKEEYIGRSQFYQDVDRNEPLELSIDFGSAICVMVVGQEHHFDFVTGCVSSEVCDTQVAEYFVKPDGTSNLMIDDLANRFCDDFAAHRKKVIVYYKDKYGDSRNPNVQNNKSYNDMMIAKLESRGWTVVTQTHKGMEPPMNEKYLLWGVLLKESMPGYPRIRFNGDRCRYLLTSMEHACVVTNDNKTYKDKSSEKRGSGVPPEEATHFSDAIDKKIWTKYGYLVKQ